MPNFFLPKFLFILKLIVITNIIYSQCPINISGTPCLLNPLTANVSGFNFDTLKWTLGPTLQMIKVKRNPFATVVAGGGATNASMLSGPEDVFVDSIGNIYVVDGNRHRVQMWAPGATSGITVAGENGKGCALNQFGSPKGIAVDKLGNVYVSDAICDRVTKWSRGATSGVVVAGGNGEGGNANQLNGNLNICLDKAGNLYIADRWNHRVQKWAPGATSGVTVAGGSYGSTLNQLVETMDVDVDDAGNVYVIDYFNNRVMKWLPGATTGILVAGGNGRGSAANQFDFTTALSVSPNGSIFVRDQNNSRIQKWVPGATYGVTVAGGNAYGGPSVLDKVSVGFGLFVDSDENVYVPELFQNTVNKFSIGSKIDTLYTPTIAGEYVVKGIQNNGCEAQSPIFYVLGPVKGPFNVTGPRLVFPGRKGLKFSVTNAPGNDFSWSVPTDATIISGQGTSSIVVDWGNTSGQLIVTISNGCGGKSRTVVRDINIKTSIITANYLNNKQHTPGGIIN